MTRARNVAAASCGLAAVALAVLVPLAAGHTEPGYSHRSQFISELGAVGAAHARLVSLAGFAPIGTLVLAFLFLAYPSFPGGKKTAAGFLSLAAVGIAYLVAAAFPCDPGCPRSGSTSQAVHNAFGLLEYVGAGIGLVMLGSVARVETAWRRLLPWCVSCAAVLGAAFLAMLSPELASVRGLSQRMAEASIFTWLAVASVLLLPVASSRGPATRG